MKILKKTHKLNTKNLTYSRHLLKFGTYGLKVLSDLHLTKDQIVSIERNLTKKLKDLSSATSKLKFWSFLQVNKTLTKLSLESRMGKGKGPIHTEVLYIKKGTLIYEFNILKSQQVREIYFLVEKYISVKLKLISRK